MYPDIQINRCSYMTKSRRQPCKPHLCPVSVQPPTKCAARAAAIHAQAVCGGADQAAARRGEPEVRAGQGRAAVRGPQECVPQALHGPYVHAYTSIHVQCLLDVAGRGEFCGLGLWLHVYTSVHINCALYVAGRGGPQERADLGRFAVRGPQQRGPESLCC